MKETTVKIKCLGIISEIAESEIIQMELPSDTGILRKQLSIKYPILDKIQYAISIDGEVTDNRKIIGAESNIYLIPQFAGG